MASHRTESPAAPPMRSTATRGTRLAGPLQPGPPRRGWQDLFWTAFKRSRNPMVLLDERRRHVDVNGAYLELLGYRRDAMLGQPAYRFVAGGPLASAREWHAILYSGDFTGIAPLVCADGRVVTVQYAAHPEVVTGKRLVLFVAIQVARGARRLRGEPDPEHTPPPLSKRELEIVRLIALGRSGPEIAAELHITHNTVRTHVRNAMTKLGVRSRAQLVAKSLGEGLALR